MLKTTESRARGQALVEFALIFGIVMMFLFVIVEGARAFQAWQTVQTAAREAARYAITGQFDSGCLVDCEQIHIEAIRERALQATSGLIIDPEAGYDVPHYLRVQVFGVDESGEFKRQDGQLVESAGVPGKPVFVRVTYHLPVITPLLRPITPFIRVRGEVIMNNEIQDQISRGQTGSSAPGVPPLPTPGPPPPPPPPPVCPTIIMEGQIWSDDVAVTVSGNLDSAVVLKDLTANMVLGTAVLVDLPTSACYDGGGHIFSGLDLSGRANHLLAILVDNEIEDTRLVHDANIGSVDLAIVKGAVPNPVVAGNNLFYTIQVRNNARYTATGVVVTDTLPESVILLSAPPECQHSGASPAGTGGLVVCSLPDLEEAQNSAVTLVVRPSAPGIIRNVADVIANEPDSNPLNNSSSINTTVNPVNVDLSVTLSGSPDPVTVGNQLTYHIVVRNHSSATATGVKLSDMLPADSNFVSATPSQGDCGAPTNGTITCNLHQVPGGSTANVAIVVQPTAEGALTNRVSVLGHETDPNLTNNVASTTTMVESSNTYITVTPTCGPAGTSFAVQGFNWDTGGQRRVYIYWNTVDDPDLYNFTNDGANWSTPPIAIPAGAGDGNHLVLAKRVVTGNTEVMRTAAFVIPCAQPDLEISRPRLISEEPILENEPVTFSVAITNSGTAAVFSPFNVGLYFDPVPEPTGSTTHIAPTFKVAGSSVNGLAAGAGQTITFTIPSGFTGAYTHSVYGVVDSDPWPTGLINEPNETNNVSPPLLVPVQALPPADLIIGQPILASGQPITAHTGVDFQVTITNSGVFDIHSQFFVGLYFDPSPSPISSTTHISQEFRTGLVAISGLAAGADRTVTLRADSGFDNQGAEEAVIHTVYAVVDAEPAPSGLINEPDESNNISAPLLVEVQPGDPPESPPPPPQDDPGALEGTTRIWRNGTMALQANVLVRVIDQDGRIYVTYSDFNALYHLLLPPGAYTVTGCINIDGQDYFAVIAGVLVASNETSMINLYLLAQPCS